jgi:RNA polymerase sigma-70 factor (ECF subfamily)
VRTDEELALGVQRGGKDDLAALVERHHSPLLGYLYRMTGGDRALAEDLVQETFLRVLKSISQYRHPRPFKAWLYAIATNIARDHYKRADVRRTAALPDSDALGVDPIGDWEDDALAGEQSRRLIASVRALPDHQREAIVLRYVQMLSLADIAEALDVPLGTVKSRLSLGLKRLREVMERER